MVDALRAHRVVVVGAGVAGLVSALLLACRGLQVTLIERAETPGGKMRRVVVDGAGVDSGPTVFTMRWVFEQIFEADCSSLTDELRLQPLQLIAGVVDVAAHGGVRPVGVGVAVEAQVQFGQLRDRLHHVAG